MCVTSGMKKVLDTTPKLSRRVLCDTIAVFLSTVQA